MNPEGRRPRDPNAVSIEFPEGKRLRTSASARRGGSAFAFFVAGILLGAAALGAGYWLRGAQTNAPPPDEDKEATVDMQNIMYVPSDLTVDLGTKVTWLNKDPVYHTVTSDDASGPLDSPNIQAGESFAFTFTEAGVYPYHCVPHASLQGGRYVGMIGTITVREGGGGGGNGTPIDLPHTTYDATTSAPPPGWHEWNFTLRAQEVWLEVGEKVPYAAWTFDGTLPGPAFRVRQGDQVNIRLINEGSMNHSIDFHSARINWATAYRDVPPGDTHTYSFTADYPGVYMYHCGSNPVLSHVANGMYGVMIVDPLNDTRPAPDWEYVLVLSEVYASDRVNGSGVYTGDLDKMLAAEPTQVVFNGYAFQYDPRKAYGQALPASAGERIRVYVLNAGPTLVQSFHVIGAIFDRVYVENNPNNAMEGIQTWTLPSSGGAAFDLIMPDPGLYPFVTHSFAYTGLGAVGVFAVT
jgi:copper-containing nitrite reductase